MAKSEKSSVLNITWLFSEGYNCNCESDGLPCNYRGVFGEVTEMVKDYLKKQTFDKLVKF